MKNNFILLAVIVILTTACWRKDDQNSSRQTILASGLQEENLLENSRKVISLPYTGAVAVSCEVTDLENVEVTSSCVCSNDLCSVEVRSLGDYFGDAAFNYRVASLDGVSSNQARANLRVLRTNYELIGSGHNCILNRLTKELFCFGYNNSGQIGNGSNLNYGDDPNEVLSSLSPLNLGTGFNIEQVVSGADATCALSTEGLVKCWGNNLSGQLGLGHKNSIGDNPNEMGDSLVAVDLGTGKSAILLAASSSSFCSILDNNSVKCWGANDVGQLGLGDSNHRGDAASEMGDLLPELAFTDTVVDIDGGDRFFCAKFLSGNYSCWGRNQFGQLAIGNIYTNKTTTTYNNNYRIGDQADEIANLIPISIGTASIKSLHVVDDYTMVIDTDSRLYCFGNSIDGVCGTGASTLIGDDDNEVGEFATSIDLGTNLKIDTLAYSKNGGLGTNSICAILSNDTVKCWGSNAGYAYEQSSAYGNEANEMGDNLPAVNLGTHLKPIKVWRFGNNNYCVTFEDASLKCWGNNSSGGLGLGHSTIIGDSAGELGENLSFYTLPFTPSWISEY